MRGRLHQPPWAAAHRLSQRGFISGITFYGILAAIESRRGVDRVSLPRFAGWGVVSGLLPTGIFAVGGVLRGASNWGELFLFGLPPNARASPASRVR